MSQSFKLPGSRLHADLWQSQNHLCAVCGKLMLANRYEAPHATIWAKHRATLDHIVPKSKGGSDRRDNLQLVHARCNKIKGNRV